MNGGVLNVKPHKICLKGFHRMHMHSAAKLNTLMTSACVSLTNDIELYREMVG